MCMYIYIHVTSMHTCGYFLKHISTLLKDMLFLYAQSDDDGRASNGQGDSDREEDDDRTEDEEED